MGYLQFDKNEIVNLEYSLNKEIVRSNRSGSYSCTTIVGCNTRKYHGLLVCPIEEIDGERHVILSSLDVTVVQHDAEFNFGLHKYPPVSRDQPYVEDPGSDYDVGPKIGRFQFYKSRD